MQNFTKEIFDIQVNKPMNIQKKMQTQSTNSKILNIFDQLSEIVKDDPKIGLQQEGFQRTQSYLNFNGSKSNINLTINLNISCNPIQNDTQRETTLCQKWTQKFNDIRPKLQSYSVQKNIDSFKKSYNMPRQENPNKEIGFKSIQDIRLKNFVNSNQKRNQIQDTQYQQNENIQFFENTPNTFFLCQKLRANWNGKSQVRPNIFKKQLKNGLDQKIEEIIDLSAKSIPTYKLSLFQQFQNLIYL